MIEDSQNICASVIFTSNLWAKMRGLLGERHHTWTKRCMVLTNCKSVHTVGMDFCLDIAFLDRELRVLKVERNVAANRFIRGPKHTYATLERAYDLELSWPKVGELLTLRIR